MLKLSDIRLAEKCDFPRLRQIAAGVLGVPESSIHELQIHKLSVDARRKPDVRFVYTLLVSVDGEHEIHAGGASVDAGDAGGAEAAGAAGYVGDAGDARPGDPPDSGDAGYYRLPRKNISVYTQQERYAFPSPFIADPGIPPVIVGTGPAGLFAALCLAEAGVKCVILERGQPVERRVRDVSRFWSGGGLDISSNVQFGEGGAGTFSDGKLSTGINDRRIRFVLENFVRFGAPEEILYLAKPHIGTDKLRGVVRAVRERITELGCDVRFGHRLDDVSIWDGALRSITVEGDGAVYELAADKLVLAPGNSARDTFGMLYKRGVRLSPKDFAVGVRIEHLQRDIDETQYSRATLSSGKRFPASDYKLAVRLRNGRAVYTFCVCPGGCVVASASEQGGVVTNGMSNYARDGENISGALLVSVTQEDFGRGALDGVEFQRGLERAAFIAGGGNYCAPAQLVGDFLNKRASTGHGKTAPTYAPGVKYCSLWDVLPGFLSEALCEALPELSKRVACFSDPDAVMTAVETRSSCPLRIERENCESVNVRGIFPCGEGAGYAGGIMSAAVDGIKCAEQIALAISSAR